MPSWAKRKSDAPLPGPFQLVYLVFSHDAVAQRYGTQKITFSGQGIRMLPVALRYA